MTVLEESVEQLIAYKLLTSTTGSISDRAKRKYEGIGTKIAERLKTGDKLPEDSSLTIRLGWSDEVIVWARKISLALEEFKQVNPEAYNQLEEIREKHKNVRRTYLEFGGEIPDEVYIKVIQETIKGMNYEEAEMFYERIKDVTKKLDKTKKEGLQRFLLPE